MSCEDLRDRVRRFIESEGMIGTGEVVVVAVSGGLDSVFLFEALKRMARPLALQLHVAHINHGLRGEQSQADARFVEALARQAQTPFYLRTLHLSQDVPRRKRHASPESQWREARYGALREIASHVHARCVALGHTRDDLAETVLMRLLRGTGLEGLGAFGPLTEREGLRLCRPLVTVSRDAIEQYARDHELRWREDPSNADMNRMRNRIRQGLIPYLEKEFNPSIQSALARTARLAQSENAYLEAQADQLWREWTRDAAPDRAPERIATAALQACSPVLLRRLLRRWMMALSGEVYPPTYGETCGLFDLVKQGRAGTCYEYQRRWRFQKTQGFVVACRFVGRHNDTLGTNTD